MHVNPAVTQMAKSICFIAICVPVQHKQVDVLPSKNQALSEYCTHLSKLKHC